MNNDFIIAWVLFSFALKIIFIGGVIYYLVKEWRNGRKAQSRAQKETL